MRSLFLLMCTELSIQLYSSSKTDNTVQVYGNDIFKRMNIQKHCDFIEILLICIYAKLIKHFLLVKSDRYKLPSEVALKF